MEDNENIKFQEKYEIELKLIMTNFKEVAKYSCPCKRKNMSSLEWQNYKDEYFSNVWKCLHNITFAFLTNPSKKSQLLIFNLLNIQIKKIPCSICNRHYSNYLKSCDNLKTICSNKLSLVIWMIDLHNDVNKRLNKKEYSYKEVFEIYNFNYDNCILNWS